jgi:hypothetical protein
LLDTFDRKDEVLSTLHDLLWELLCDLEKAFAAEREEARKKRMAAREA